MFLWFILIMGSVTYAEFLIQRQLYAWLTTRVDGVSAVLFIGLSFFVAAALGFRLIRFKGGSLLRDLKKGHISAAASLSLQSVMTFVAGFLLVMPGYLSDILALLCLFPPTAWLIGKGAGHLFKKKFAAGNVKFYGSSGFGQGARQAARPRHEGFRDSDTIDVEAHDISKNLIE